jgi:hypothetical protein
MLRSKQDTRRPRIVQITYDSLYLLLYLFTEKASKSGEWVAPLGIFVSLLLTFLVSDFKNRFGLEAGNWRLLVILAMVICVLWLTRGLVRQHGVPKLVVLMQDIVDKSIKRDENRELFVVKALSDDNLMRFLVYRDPVWDTFFFLHVPYNPELIFDASHVGHLSACVASYLGVNFDKVTVTHLEELDLFSSKVSERTKLETFYTFRFWVVSLKCEATTLRNLRQHEFELGGTQYCWKTLPEMQAHPNTANKNADVIEHLFNNLDTLAGAIVHSTDELIQIGMQRKTGVTERQTRRKNSI